MAEKKTRIEVWRLISEWKKDPKKFAHNLKDTVEFEEYRGFLLEYRLWWEALGALAPMIEEKKKNAELYQEFAEQAKREVEHLKITRSHMRQAEPTMDDF